MIYCYSTAGKRKAARLMRKFAEGCRVNGLEAETVAPTRKGKLVDAPHTAAVLYGQTPYTLAIIEQCQREGVDFYYMDNAYYYGRSRYFRCTKNAMMHQGIGVPNWSRFQRFDIDVKEFANNDDGHILITTQSDLFYGYFTDVNRQTWVDELTAEIESFTGREIRVCWKPPAPATYQAHAPEFESMLEGAYCLVTHSSSTCVKAAADGIPVFVTDPTSCGAPIGYTDLSALDRANVPPVSAREHWLAVLMGNQWSEPELENGTAWRELDFLYNAGPASALAS